MKLCMLDESWICQKALHHPLLQHNMLCCLVMFLQGISCNAMPFWLTDIYVSCRHWLERNGWETLIQMFLKSQFLISLLNLIWECILDGDMIESLLYSMITDAIFTFLVATEISIVSLKATKIESVLLLRICYCLILNVACDVPLYFEIPWSWIQRLKLRGRYNVYYLTSYVGLIYDKDMLYTFPWFPLP